MTSRASIGLVLFCLSASSLQRAGAATVSNSNPITIPDAGAATPFPSDVDVSGLNGTIATVTATLTGFNHTCPKDVDVLLVGPTGASVMLMSDTGDCTETAHPDATVTFDDAAASAVPCRNATPRTDQPFTPVTGSYQPGEVSGPGGTGDTHCETNHTPNEPDSLPSPAPQAPYGAALADFVGTDPNGVWHLYVNDDSSSDSGSIASWSLTITTSVETTSTTTTTTLPGCTSAPTYPSIECREDALAAAIQASSGFTRPKLQTVVTGQARRLKAATVKAEGQTGPKAGKNGLKAAIRDAKAVVSRLSSLNARHTIGGDVRTALIDLVRPIATDLATLRKSL